VAVGEAPAQAREIKCRAGEFYKIDASLE